MFVVLYDVCMTKNLVNSSAAVTPKALVRWTRTRSNRPALNGSVASLAFGSVEEAEEWVRSHDKFNEMSVRVL